MKASGSSFKIISKEKRMTSQERAEAVAKAPGFGHVFSEHMVTIKWSEDKGWHDATISPYHHLTLSPASTVFHYGQEIFEGMKAFHTPQGGVQLFRPDANAARFQQSAERLAMPVLPQNVFVEAVTKLVDLDRDWVPTQQGSSLYVRPFMIATQAALGVKPASDFLFIVIACPVAEYFSKKAGPVSVWIEKKTVRACHGGTGTAKCGGNYAGSLVAQREGSRQGCQQVLFLDAFEHRWLEEMGGMNIFFVKKDNVLVTPPLTDGTILHGITRDSIITLAREMGLRVEQRRLSVDELYEGAANGDVKEAFACGTAAVIAPIGRFKSAQGDCEIGGGKTGALTYELKNKLCDIQFGRAPDAHGWIHKVGS